jgi:hypothetical protein
MYLVFVCVLGLAPAAGADLVAHWTLDEASGDVAADSSGKENHGTWEGGPTVVEGVSGNALAFNNSRVTIPASDSLTADFFQKSFTLTAWINPARTGNTWQQIFRSMRTDGTTNDTLFINNDGRLSWRGRVNAAWAGGMCETAAGVVPANEWTHAAVVGDGTSFRVYVRGALSQESAFQKTDAMNVTYYLGGNPAATTEFYNGKVDEVRVYSHALTAAEVKQLAARPKAYGPNPADGANAVAMPLLQWTAGTDAVLHNVYLGTSPELTEANLAGSRQPFAMLYYAAGLTPGATYYWRVDEITPNDTLTVGDVWTFTAQALTAYLPAPGDGAKDASVDPNMTLTWLPGRSALEHHVYFGASADAVQQGAAGTDKGNVKNATFAPGALEPLTTYYWRVDEIGLGGAVQTGAVWAFTTVRVIDDFEAYTDDLDAKATIFDAWIDGLTNGLSGSVVGNAVAPFAEQTVVHGGKQSLPMDYNNVRPPFYSEAARQFTPVADWTAGGAGVLILSIRGNGGNTAAPLYLAVEDSAAKVAVVVHPDPAVVKTTKWITWRIPFADLSAAGANLARVKTLRIGVGDRANPAAGGAGRIYVDDVCLTQP